MSKILIVEDNENIKNELSEFLKRYGYTIQSVENFKEAAKECISSEADLILLDINLPYYDGYFVCREIRKVKNTPIIIVTSRDSDMDEIMSMNLGADDFITKPYNTQILLARIEAVLRRSNIGNSNKIIEHKGLILNIDRNEVSFNKNMTELSKNEFKILLCLLKNKGKIVKRDKLMDYLWNSNLFVDDNTLSVNVTRLRKKLDNIGYTEGIETKRGLGYILL